MKGNFPRLVRSDPVRIRQILTNVIDNAIKFTNDGEISVRLLYEGVDSQDQHLIVQVADTGIGISRENARRVFAPWTQADDSATRSFGGAGIGLGLARRLARLLGGELSLLHSTMGKGSVFQIMIAVEQGFDTEIDPLSRYLGMSSSQLPSKNALNGLRILLAEDAEDLGKLTVTVLQRYGAKVTWVGDGEEAVKKGTEEDFDLILMDIQMPKLDGYEATRQLRQLGCETPIFALTARVMERERQQALDAGCDQSLEKPASFSLLAGLAEKHCRVGRQPSLHS